MKPRYGCPVVPIPAGDLRRPGQRHGAAAAARLAWREAELTEVEPGDQVPDDGAIYLLGGGEDAAQISAVKSLKSDGRLFEAVDRGAVVFSVCAGYQILGQSFTVGERTTR